ncbi:GIY-YIG nuclease family protein [Novisyntrophococcus fermenticellae]|uniref:GIY-YIG nuclease family protein n=1 Tax=Novisyntrophococcus fermenticellae TaxID=2068655 RepID=UPI001E4CA1A7|nr:GIY-YIG nuclease family protein [Novisyntrophococcus fermenticellae]
MNNKKSYTYILRCSDDTLYTGWTTDIQKRLNAHNSGKGARYTRPRRPVSLVYYEVFQTREEAMQREWEIKHLTRQEKLKLISLSSD